LLIEEYGNATITEIRDGIAVIQAYIGDINTSILAKLSALNATIVDVIGEGILRLETSIGAVQANLSVIRELIWSSREVILAIENSTWKLQGEFGEIRIKLDDINETVVRVLLSGISDIKDQISTSTGSITSGIDDLRARVIDVQSTVRAIKSDTENINNNVATVPTVSTAIWLAVVFSLIAAILSALVTIGVRVKIAS
jgi:phage-related minor tail protein